jgi:hypothetical protein
LKACRVVLVVAESSVAAKSVAAPIGADRDLTAGND